MIPLLDAIEVIGAPPTLGVDGPLRLRRAWPKGEDRILVEYVGASGAVVPGQLVLTEDGVPDPAAARRLVARIRRHARTPDDVCTPRDGLVLQARGADRRLRALAPLLAQTGASLVSHRPERRAVVRLDDGPRVTYAKVVRRGRVQTIVSRARAAQRAPGLRVPGLARTDTAAGVVEWDRLPGTLLHDIVTGTPPSAPSAPSAPSVPAAVRAAGAALRTLHDGIDPLPLAPHLAGHELTALEGWTAAVARHDVALGRRLRAALPAVRRRLDGGCGSVVALHRDYHDKQTLVTPDATAGLIDLDTLARGEPALDVANFLVHLELRSLQDRLAAATADALAAAFLDGYGPEPELAGRLASYAAATRLRLACVYAFRPGSGAVVEGMREHLTSRPERAA